MSYYRRYRQPKPNKGTVQSDKPLIFWDDDRNKYVIKCPFSEVLKNKLMVLCHTATYLGKNEQAWAINADELDRAKVLVEAMFGEFDFIAREEREQAKFSMSNSSAANNAAVTLFTTAGPEISRKFWLNVIKQFHSDVSNGQDTSKAADINLAWDQLKKELGW